MKKKLLKSTFVVGVMTLAGIGGSMAYNKYAISEEPICNFLLQNVEALAGSEGPENTGPGQIYDCPGIGTGDGKMCMCENSHPCTQVLCKEKE